MRFDRRADRVSAFPFFRQVSSIRFLCKSFRADYLSYVCFVICLAEKKEEKERDIDIVSFARPSTRALEISFCPIKGRIRRETTFFSAANCRLAKSFIGNEHADPFKRLDKKLRRIWVRKFRKLHRSIRFSIVFFPFFPSSSSFPGLKLEDGLASRRVFVKLISYKYRGIIMESEMGGKVIIDRIACHRSID